MIREHGVSFLVIVSLIFLLPVFFVPGGALNLPNSKAVLLTIGASVGVLAFVYEAWKNQSLSLPAHKLFFAALALPAVYLLSALLSTPSSLSLFGYNFEVGTFGQILAGAALLTIAAVSFTGTSSVLKGLIALFVSLSLVALFTVLKLLSGGEWLTLGNFPGVAGSPVGSWTDLSVALALLSILSIIALNMLSMKRAVRVTVFVVFVLSILLSTVFNFQNALTLSLAASVILFFYFFKVESHYLSSQSREGRIFSKMTILPFALGLVSLIVLANPFITKDQRLAVAVSEMFGANNTDVRPTLSTTLSISKAALSQEALLGSGPNTFSRDWLIYRPAAINTTPFWGVTFPVGAGFIPTQVAATGILGTALWLAFFILLISLGLKFASDMPESRAERFVLLSSFSASLFLWASSFLYGPSLALLTLAFIMTGVFLAASRDTGLISVKSFNFDSTPSAKFYFSFILALAATGALALGFAGGQRGLAAFHYQRAIRISNTDGATLAEIEGNLEKAISYSAMDAYYVALSRINFAKAEVGANAATGTPEENRGIFEEGIARSIAAARSAVSVNPAGYDNWVTLGGVYSALVPEPLKVEGAYENALFAFNEASRRNPNNPELPLLLAQLELNRGEVERARSYIRSSIALKQDFAEAYILLAKLEVEAKNLPAAIASAEVLAQLSPDNPGVYFEIGLLKYSGRDFEGALESFEKALELLPEYANAKYYLGLTLLELGDKVGARQKFDELLASDPDNEALKNAIDSLESREEQRKR